VKNVFKCAGWGGLAWLAYGLIELIATTSVQMWRSTDVVVPNWQWPWILLLLGVYAVLGFAAGIAGGIVLRMFTQDEPSGAAQTFVAWSIAAAFLLNLILVRAFQGPELIAGVVAVVICVTLGMGLIRGYVKPILFLASPWIVSVLLISAPWVVQDVMEAEGLHATAVLAALGAMAVVVLIAILWRRMRHYQLPTLRGQAALAVGVLAVFGLVTLTRGGNPKVPGGVTAAESPSKPNVVLITMDTVRADHTSVNGYQRDTTPFLRSLSESATVYTRATATSDFTLPTHASLFTGVYPEWHGALRDGTGLHPVLADRPMLAELLASNGYWTAQSAANHGYMVPWTGLTRGFQVAESRRPVLMLLRRGYLRYPIMRFLGSRADIRVLTRRFLTAADIGARAQALLDRAGARGGPFFLFLNYMDAHQPYIPGKSFEDQFPAGQDLASEHVPMQRRIGVSRYDAAVFAEDASIGQVVGHLKDLGLYDNTILVITSDHGEAFAEHDLLTHDVGFVYQELIGVPLLIKFPGQTQGRRSDQLISQVDIMPMILGLTGVPVPPGIQGSGRLIPDAERAVFAFSVAHSVSSQTDSRLRGTRRAILAGALKLITWTAGPPELYDLTSDPEEKHNIYQPDDQRAKDLSQRLDAWVASMPASKAAPFQLDSATKERLRSLGYVQ
jgi:arylsulfatase A-like enzyme